MVNKLLKLFVFFFVITNVYSFDEVQFVSEITYPKSNKFINIAVDNVGRIYLTQKAKTSIQVFNKFGSQIDMIILKSKKILEKNGSVKITRKGEIAILDTASSLLKKFDPDGNVLFTLGQRGSAGGNFRSPQDFVIDKQENIYVADTGNRRVQIFNRDGIYVAVIKSGDKLNAETNNFRLVKHESFTGTPIRKFPQLKSPVDVEVDSESNIFVLDVMTKFVVIYNSKGEYMGNINLNEVKGIKDIKPISMALSGNKIFILDEKYHNIKVFNRRGIFLQEIGVKGSGRAEFYKPNDIVFSDNKLFVLDSGNNRVQILSYAKQEDPKKIVLQGLLKKEKPNVALIEIGSSENKSALEKEINLNFNKFISESGKFTVRDDIDFPSILTEIGADNIESLSSDYLRKIADEYDLDLAISGFYKKSNLTINLYDIQSGIIITSFTEKIDNKTVVNELVHDLVIKIERSYLNREGAPLAPVGLFAMSSVSSIFLKWDPNQEEDVISYALYSSDSENGTFTKLAESEQNEYQIPDLKDDSTIYIKITALDSEGKESVFSEVISCKTRKLPDFGYILDVKPVSYAKKIKFKWSNPEKEQIVSYQVFRSETQDGNYLLVGTTKKKKFIDTGLVEGTTYFYKIRKVYADGLIGDYSNSFTIATDKKPGIIEDIEITGDLPKMIKIDWKLPKDDKDIKKIEIYRSETSDGDFVLIKSLSGRKRSYTDKKLKDNTTFFYKLKSIDKFDLESDYSAEFFATTKDIPKIPFNVAAESNLPRKINITWDDENTGRNDYIIYRSLSADGEFDQIGKVNVKHYTDNKLPDNVTRYYFITVRDEDKLLSKPSDIVSATTKSLPLTPDNLKTINNLPKKITLIWDPNKEADIVKYNIYKSEKFNGKYKNIGSTEKTVFTDDNDKKGLLDNMTYYYKISALDSDNLESELTKEVSGRTKNTPPSPDNITIAAYKDTALIISWPPVTGNEIFGYYVYKNRKMIELVKSNIFIDNKVKKGKSYVYQISAIDNDKLEGKKSEKIKFKLP